MNENLDSPNTDILDAELLVQDGIVAMQTLWDEVRPRSDAAVEFAYLDGTDHMSKIRFAVQDNSTPLPKYIVASPSGDFKILATREELHEAAWVSPSTPTVKEVLKMDMDTFKYSPAAEEDVVELAKYLKQLDVDEVRSSYALALAHRRKAKAPKLGGRMLRLFHKD